MGAVTCRLCGHVVLQRCKKVREPWQYAHVQLVLHYCMKKEEGLESEDSAGEAGEVKEGECMTSSH